MKNLWKEHLGESVFHIILTPHLIMGVAPPSLPPPTSLPPPPIPFRIFMDHVTIFSSSSMQHLSRRSLWQKMEPTLKCINKFRLRQENIPTNIYIFKVSKNRTTCQMYLKLNNKDTRMISGAFIVNFEHISHFVQLLLMLNLNR